MTLGSLYSHTVLARAALVDMKMHEKCKRLQKRKESYWNYLGFIGSILLLFITKTHSLAIAWS